MKVNRIAVVSDIHANIHALKVFMEYLDARPEINIVLNLGDFLQFGPNPVEVFEIVIRDKRFINILGNNEMELFQENEEETTERTKHINWTKSMLGMERLNQLMEVPKSRAVDLYGKKFMLVHTVTEQYVDLEELKKCEYVLMGHTHLQVFGSYWKEKRIMNPGSVGYTPEGIVNFAVIEINGEMINFVFKNTKYNNQGLYNDLVVREVPMATKIIDYLIQPDKI